MSSTMHLHCDFPSCDAEHAEATSSDWIARLRAEDQHGWHTSTAGDYCPQHTRSLDEH